MGGSIHSIILLHALNINGEHLHSSLHLPSSPSYRNRTDVSELKEAFPTPHCFLGWFAEIYISNLIILIPISNPISGAVVQEIKVPVS